MTYKVVKVKEVSNKDKTYLLQDPQIISMDPNPNKNGKHEIRFWFEGKIRKIGECRPENFEKCSENALWRMIHNKKMDIPLFKESGLILNNVDKKG